MKLSLITIVAIALLFTVSCGTTANNSTAKNSAAGPEIKKGVAPVADDEIAVIERNKNGPSIADVVKERFRL